MRKKTIKTILIIFIIAIALFFIYKYMTFSIIPFPQIYNLNIKEVEKLSSGIKYEVSWSRSLGEIRDRFDPKKDIFFQGKSIMRSGDYNSGILCIPDDLAVKLEEKWKQTYEAEISGINIIYNYFDGTSKTETQPLSLPIKAECILYRSDGGRACNYKAEIWCKMIELGLEGERSAIAKTTCPETTPSGKNNNYCTVGAPTSGYFRFKASYINNNDNENGDENGDVQEPNYLILIFFILGLLLFIGLLISLFVILRRKR